MAQSAIQKEKVAINDVKKNFFLLYISSNMDKNGTLSLSQNPDVLGKLRQRIRL